MITEKFSGKFNSLDQVCSFIGKACVEAGFDDNTTYAVEMAVDEAFSNVIDHALQGEDKGDVEISYSITPDSLVIMMRDYGKSFDPDLIPQPDLCCPIEERKERGLGLFFMRKLMDEIHYDFSTKNGNLLTMVKLKERIA
jgi:serine/threonine-protein kinase RsbW